MPVASAPLEQLDAVLGLYAELHRGSGFDDLSNLDRSEWARFTSLALAAIERIGGRGSAYTLQAEGSIAKWGIDHPLNVAVTLGIVKSLRHDVSAGYLQSVHELIHAELFADFLEMADHLLESGYKDSAAVIAGTALEAHLRQLCIKEQIDLIVHISGATRPKNAEQLNSELAARGAYSKLDQKNVTAWLGLRNKAAHGHYAEYEKAQVSLLIASVRDFISRLPA